MNRKNNFDAVRVLAALAVVYSHAFPLAGVPGIHVLGNSVGALAVKVFFVLSGFLVAKSWSLDENFFRYISKRTLRIFPALLLLLAITVFIAGPLLTKVSIGEYFSDQSVWQYLYKNAALSPVYAMSDLFQGNPYPSAVNGSLWSLPVEFLMYIMLPLIYLLMCAKNKGGAFLIFTMLLCFFSLKELRMGEDPTQFVFYGTSLASTLDVSPYFFIGATYSIYKLDKKLNTEWALYMIGLAALLQPTSSFLMEITLYIVIPYSVLAFSTSSTPFLRSFGRYGDPSYGIYLYGFPVQQTVFSLAPNGISPLINFLISTPLILALSYFSWHAIEKHALKIKPMKNLGNS